MAAKLKSGQQQVALSHRFFTHLCLLVLRVGITTSVVGSCAGWVVFVQTVDKIGNLKVYLIGICK